MSYQFDVKKHVSRNYKTLNKGYTVNFTRKFVDQFLVASHEDKWREFELNTTVIDRGGFVWTRKEK